MYANDSFWTKKKIHLICNTSETSINKIKFSFHKTYLKLYYEYHFPTITYKQSIL